MSAYVSRNLCKFAGGKIIIMMNESFVIQSNIAQLPYVEERVFHFCRECNVGNYYSAVSVAVLQAVENATSMAMAPTNRRRLPFPWVPATVGSSLR